MQWYRCGFTEGTAEKGIPVSDSMEQFHKQMLHCDKDRL